MPPREFESGPTLVIRSNSFEPPIREERVLDNVETHFCRYDGLLQEYAGLGCFEPEILNRVETLLKTAKNIDSSIEMLEESTLSTACRIAIRENVSKALDGVQNLSDGEMGMKSDNAVFVLGIGRALELAAKMEVFVARLLDPKLEAQLRFFLGGKCRADGVSIRLSNCASSIAFELGAAPVSFSCLPISVSVEPFIFFRAPDIVDDTRNLATYRQCKVNIESCSHKPLYRSSRGGTVGDAIVRVRVSEGQDEGSRGGKHALRTWGKDGDVEKFRVVEVRA